MANLEQADESEEALLAVKALEKRKKKGDGSGDDDDDEIVV